MRLNDDLRINANGSHIKQANFRNKFGNPSGAQELLGFNALTSCITITGV